MKQPTERRQLPNDCEDRFDEQLKTAKGQSEYQDLVRLITQVLDVSGSGEDCSLRISATKNKDAYVVTLYQEGAASYASGLTWDGLLQQVALLL